MVTKKIEMVISLERCDNVLKSILIKELFDAITTRGLSDSSIISDISLKSNENDWIYDRRLIVEYYNVIGIGHTGKNYIHFLNVFTDLFNRELKNIKPSVNTTKSSTDAASGEDVFNPLSHLQDKINKAIEKSDIYKANELLDLLERYKTIVLN